jgi:tetratricopeptide (TPR) repeat protein/CRP-like cAMP-binding protein
MTTIKNPGQGTFWRALGAPERGELFAIGRLATVPAKGALCHQGVPSPEVVVFVKGFGKESMDSQDGTEAIIELFGPGDLEGDFAIWGHPQRATVTALVESKILRIERRKFAALVAANPRVSDALMRTLATRWTYAGRRSAVHGGSPGQRVAFHLQELAVRFGYRAPHGIEIPMPFSQAELANWIGISRESLVRAYARWRGTVIDTSHPRGLVVLDPQALRREAQPWGEEWELPEPAPTASARLAVRPPVTLGRAGEAAHLPRPGRHFTGRRRELANLSLLLADRPQVIVIQGMAGVGKTALATYWAWQLADSFPDGQLFVDLRGPRKPSTPVEALGQVLRGLGVPGDQLPGDEPELTALLQSLMADRRVLLVLDNASGEFEQIQPLIPTGNGGLVLVTTQQRLSGGNLPTLELGEMEPAEAVELVDSVLGDGRVASERMAAEDLARQCAYLPLALRIAAARLAGAQDERIADTVRELSGRDRLSAFALPDDTHSALRAAFEVSYSSLDEETRSAFRLIALTVGPDFDTAAVAALLGCAEPAALELLDRLKRAFLVVDSGESRHRQHDLLRRFAHELGLLEDAESERQSARRRLLSYYLKEARNSRHALTGPARQRAIAWFESERRCLIPAVRQCARMGLHRMAYGLAGTLYDFLEFRRYSEDNIAVHRFGLSSAQAVEDWAAAALMLHHLSVANLELGRCVRAIGYGEDARRGFRALADRSGEARVLDTLAAVYGALGRPLMAIEHAQEALNLHRELGEAEGEAKALDTLAQDYQRLGLYDEAYDYACRALEIRRFEGDRRGEAETLLNLARVHRQRGNFQQALMDAFEALEVRQELQHPHGEAEARTELAALHQQLGVHDLAKKDTELALRIYRSVGARHGEGEALVTLARIAISEYRHAEAFSHCAEALKVLRAIGHRNGEAAAIAEYGIAHFWLGRYPEARENLQRSLEIRRSVGDRHGEAHDLHYLARVARRLGRTREAFVHGLEALALWQELGAREGEAGTLDSLARTYLRLGLGEEAQIAAEQGLTIRREIDDAQGLGTGLDTLALILRRTGRPLEALTVSQEALTLLEEIGDRHGTGQALVNLAETHLALGQLPDARRCTDRALAIATDLNDRRNQAAALHTLALVRQRQRRHDKAVVHFEEEVEIRSEMGDLRGQILALTCLAESFDALGDVRAALDRRRRINGIQRWLG